MPKSNMGGKNSGPAVVNPKASSVNSIDMSVGNFHSKGQYPPAKTTGIKIRGTGAATKGVMARGPMA
jgi:hypothetical protein